MKSTNELVAIENASRALAQARTIGEIKEIRDKAEAVRKYAQSAALGLSAQNHAAEVKLRAERKAGHLLSRLPLRGGDRKSNSRGDCLKLEDLGISQNQSTRWQLQAKLPESEFEAYLHLMRETGREISSVGIVRLAQRVAKGVIPHKVVSSRRNDADRAGLNGHHASAIDARDGRGRVINALDDLSQHRNLLNQILQPLYAGKDEDLLPAQRRVLGHILREMQMLIEELQLFARQDALAAPAPSCRTTSLAS